MTQWFNVVNEKIVGTGRGKLAPSGVVEVDETTFTLYQTLKKQAQLEGRKADITYIGGVVSLAEDNRIILKFDVSTNDNVEGTDAIEANGIDEAVITISVMDEDEITVRTGVNATRILPLFGGRLFKVTVTNGVGTISFKTEETGYYSVQSNNIYKLVGETQIVALDY